MYKTKILTGVLVLAVLLASCATVESVPKEKSVQKFVELFDSGDSDRLTAMTHVPMLVDGEIVARSPDAEYFWTMLENAGFSFSESESFTMNSADSATRKIFGSSKEVDMFFDKYVPGTAVVVKVAGPGGIYRLLLSGRKGGYPYIFGFTGPANE